ncbi:MAG TPA: hypothetical protein VM261_00475 [Kofleriaceae bacterium]|nr:hypothetical protein [Kofleriaceae bacterium]
MLRGLARAIGIAVIAIVIAIAIGCGGGGGAGGASGPSGPPRESLGPADMPAMRALLEQYSPSGHAVVTAYEALPDEYELVEGPRSMTTSAAFDSYFRDGNVENVVRYMSTGVHEVTHGYTGKMGWRLLADRKQPYGLGAEAILGDGEPWLVPYTKTYPALEMIASYPADARGLRFPVYIDTPDEPNLATQSRGAYGMLDEFAAYYQNAKTVMDFWPWVRDVAQGDEWLIINYAVELDDIMMGPHAEFRFYILHYLRFAKEHHPDVYAAVMSNTDFKRAFAEIDGAYTALLVRAHELEPIVHEVARSRGTALARRDGMLWIGSSAQRPEHAAAHRATLAHLEEPAYQELLRELGRARS